ncbi:MFS transporter, partial [Streptomyces sp. NPDC047097]|uniref:MFS transporter n=1 Tax=Streptomyces sp. NPDC047097 TaxID=3155260 RepID=UPI00340B130B
LILARAAQAVAAALLVRAAVAIMLTATPERAVRTRALALWASAGGIGSVAGVLLGGAAVTQLDWRWAFFLNLPVVVAGLVAAHRMCPPDGAPVRSPVDVTGAVALVGTLLALVYALVHIPVPGQGPVVWTAFAVAVALGGLFTVRQLRAAHPLLPGSVLRDRGLIAGSAGILLVSAATGPVVFIGSVYLQEAHGYSPLAAGGALLPMVGGIILVGRLCSRLLARRGPLLPCLVGCALIAAGLLVLTRVSPGSGYFADLLPGLALTGAGLPFLWMTCEVTAVAGVSRQDAGLAAGMVQSAGQIGAAVGLALAVTVYTAAGAGDAGAQDPASLSAGASRFFVVALALMVPAVLTALVGMRTTGAGAAKGAGAGAGTRRGRGAALPALTAQGTGTGLAPVPASSSALARRASRA